MVKPDVLVVGAGLFGLTIAERLANESNKKVLIIDKRGHIGGNCYSEFDEETGIECHKYGAHLFHTSNELVWKYVNKFTKFTGYIHKVYTTHDGEVYPLPINLGTINQFFHKALTPNEAKKAIEEQAKKVSGRTPKNLTDQGIFLIGEPLFDAFIKNYTAKQWQISTDELSPDIIKRLPVRYNYDNRYFNDLYEGLPVDGYEKWFNGMIESTDGKVEVRLETNYFDNKQIQELKKNNILTIYTGPIDEFFDYSFGELKWRSLRFEKEIKDVDDFQGCPVMNYADLKPEYTRIHEFKHFHPERTNDKKFANTAYASDSNKTVIVKEYSRTWERGDEPYYPVNTKDDQLKLEKYRRAAEDKSNIVFGGRLGQYAYYDMDKTIAAALECFDIIKDKL